MATEKEIKYVDAMNKMQAILNKIETGSENVDLDTLIGDVEEAAKLITTCRKRLFDTEAKIDKVLDALDSEPQEF